MKRDLLNLFMRVLLDYLEMSIPVVAILYV